MAIKKFTTRQEFFNNLALITAGALANPGAANTIWDSLNRQQLMQGIFADYELMLSSQGIQIVAETIDEALPGNSGTSNS